MKSIIPIIKSRLVAKGIIVCSDQQAEKRNLSMRAPDIEQARNTFITLCVSKISHYAVGAVCLREVKYENGMFILFASASKFKEQP